MRRAARRLANAVVLCSATLACREAPTCDNCGTLVTVVTADADVLVPALTQTAVGIQIGDQMFLKLAELGMDLNTLGDAGFVPRLARAWKFEDPVTLAFTLDPRARWQDGVPVDARDVAYTFAVYSDPSANSIARTLLVEIASVTARDDSTVVFQFKRPYAEQFYDATHHMRILPRHLLDSIPASRLAAHPFMRAPVGNGPYRFVSWRANEAVELAADTSFYLGRPGLARLFWRVANGFETAITQMVAGEADFMEFLGGPENVARVLAAPQMRVIPYTSPSYGYLGFNLWDPANLKRPNPLFGDRDLRRALTQALDRDSIRATAMGEYGLIAIGPTSRLTAIGRDTTLPGIPYDADAARQTLDRLGWKDSDGDGIRDRGGRKLAFQILVPSSSQSRQRAAVVIQDQLKKIGVDVTADIAELNEFSSRIRSRNFQAVLQTWTDDPTPSSIRQTWVTGAVGDVNYVGYSNPAFDRTVLQAVYASDPATALARYREAFSIIINDAPAAWLWNPIQPAGISARYENVNIRPDAWWATLSTWRVAPGRLTERDRIAAPSKTP